MSSKKKKSVRKEFPEHDYFRGVIGCCVDQVGTMLLCKWLLLGITPILDIRSIQSFSCGNYLQIINEYKI